MNVRGHGREPGQGRSAYPFCPFCPFCPNKKLYFENGLVWGTYGFLSIAAR